jgi:hypothetical protein
MHTMDVRTQYVKQQMDVRRERVRVGVYPAGSAYLPERWLPQARTAENEIFLKFSANIGSRATLETRNAACIPVTIKPATMKVATLPTLKL